MIFPHLLTSLLCFVLLEQVLDVPPASWDKMGIVAVLGILLGLSLKVNRIQYLENRQKEKEALEMTGRLATVIEKNTAAMEAREVGLDNLSNQIQRLLDHFARRGTGPRS